MSTYYTDREYGARPPSIDTIDVRLWAGLYTLIQTRIGDGSFGPRFPEQCPMGMVRVVAMNRRSAGSWRPRSHGSSGLSLQRRHRSSSTCSSSTREPWASRSKAYTQHHL
jgi:hypothetical protein